MDNGIELIFFDMEGTLFRKTHSSRGNTAPSAWTLIAEHLGHEGRGLDKGEME